MKGNLGSEWEVLPSEGPGDGEPRRSTMKYMALGANVQRREGKKRSRGSTQGRGIGSMGDPPGWGSADTCDTGGGSARREGAQGGGSARYHDTPHAAARSRQFLSEGGQVSRRGLGGARAVSGVAGHGVILRGGAPGAAPLQRATTMDGLSPPAGPRGG